MADVFLVPMLWKGAQYGVKSEAYPLIHSISRNLTAMPEFIYAEPELQMDAPIDQDDDDFAKPAMW